MSSSSSRQSSSRTSRSLSPRPPEKKKEEEYCDRCHKKVPTKEEEKKISMTDKSQQTRVGYDKSQDHQQQWRYASNGRRPSTRQSSCVPADGTSRGARQANIVCTKHEKEKVKMQATIEKLQEAFCDKESKLQDTKSQLVRERRMSEIMERQLKNARNLSEQLGRIIYDREQEIRTLKNLLNKRQDSTTGLKTTTRQQGTDRRRSTSKDDFQGAMRRSSSTSDHTDCPSLSSTSVDKMLKEVHSLIDGLKIKDEAIKGLQEECTRRLDKIQILQRSVQVLQDQLTQSSQQHNSACVEKENLISQLQHSLKESEGTVQSLLSEKSKVVIEGENTIQELQELLQQKELAMRRVQGQLEEALDTKETELQQMRDALDARQRDLDAKQRDLEEANEELFRSQMEGEALKTELNQEKCSLNKMSEEMNSLVDKLTTAVQEMETTKLEYQKKDERLRATQTKIQEMYIMFLGDQDITEKMQAVYRTRREIHKQQLAELQQQVTDSQAVCGILQEQLKEVTDFLDQLLHIDITSPKNLSLIKHHLHHTDNATMSKERIAPDGVSSNSQLDIEFSRQGTFEEDDTNQKNENGLSHFEFDVPHHGSFEEVGFYDQPQQQRRHYYHRSLSAENFNDSNHLRSASASDITLPTKDASEVVPISVSIQGASSDSDEIILLLNDREANNNNNGDPPRQQSSRKVVSPPFPRGLKITENYGSDGSINTRETGNNNNVIERSVSFGSFSDSVLMSYEQSERGASDESSGKVNIRCMRSIDMMDLIPVGGEQTEGARVFLPPSSDSDIWSEPDTTLSRQRMGWPRVEETTQSSDYSTTCVSEHEETRRKACPSSRCESRRNNVVHVPTKKTANKVRRWLEKLKNYLRMFEEANFHLTDEINNLCDVRSQMSAILTVKGKVDNSEAILFDLAEYIRLNFLMQKKLEKSIHFNRQLIDVFQRNISCQKKPTLDNTVLVKQTPTRHPSRQKRHPSKKTTSPPFVEDASNIPHDNRMMPYENPEIHNQLLGYHSTLMSCQDMIKDLHSQLKDRHCSEIMSKHELNRTVYGYLEDIDHCIDDLCKKMETTSNKGDSPSHSYSFKSAFSNNVTDTPEEQVYDNQEVFGTNSLMDKRKNHVYHQNQEEVFCPISPLKDNQDRLLRFEEHVYKNREVFCSSPLMDKLKDHVYQNQEEVFCQNPLMEKLKDNEDRLLRFEQLLNDKEQQLKLSAENAIQLEQQLGSIKQSLYEIQMENLELKECLELSENKQLEMEDSSSQMLRELQLTMQRLADLEERFRCLNEFEQKEADDKPDAYQYGFHNGDTWEGGNPSNIPVSTSSTYSRDWESEDY